MKQSHNALSYLRAQYSAVYGRAYVKGLATAMVVTSALASSMAQAATSDNSNSSTNRNPQPLPPRVNANSSLLSHDIKLDDLTTEQGYTRYERAANQAAYFSRSLQNKQVQAMLASEKADDEPTPTTDPTAPNHEWENVHHFGGTTTITGKGNVDPTTWYEKLNLENVADISISSNNSGSQNYENFRQLLVGSSSSNEDDQIKGTSSTQITIHDNGALQINAAGGTNNLEGSVVFDAQTAGSQAVINVGMTKEGATPSNAVLNLGSSGDSGGKVTVNAGSGTAAIYAPHVNFKGDVEIKDGAKLLLNGAITTGNKLTTIDSSSHFTGKFTVDNGVSLNIGESASVVVAKADSSGHTVLDLSSGSVNGTGTLEVQGTAMLSSTVLDGFIKPTNGSGGDVTLASGGRLELNDETTLNNYTFGTERGKSNQINVLDKGDPNFIAGDTLNLTDSIKPKGSTDDLNLNLEATSLNLGDRQFDSSANSLGYRKAVTKKVDFADASGSFHLKNDLTLDGLERKDRANNGANVTERSGSSTGNVILEQGGNYSIKQSAYTHSGGMTLKGGKLKVLADEGHNASLQVNGSFNLSSTNSSNVIISGNGTQGEATLDLTKTTVSANPNAGSNYTTFKIGNSSYQGSDDNVITDSYLKTGGKQLQDILNSGSAAILLNTTGEIDATGKDNTTDTLSLNSSQLQADSTASKGNIVFNNGGTLRAYDLTVSGSNSSSPRNINIDQGTIVTDSFKLRNTNLDSGNYHVRNSLDSDQTSIQLGNGAKLTLGDFTLDSTNTSHPDTAVDSGSLGGKHATISSNLNLQSGSTLNVKQGDWAINNGNGNLKADHATITIGAVTSGGETYQIYDDKGSGTVVGASLQGNELNLHGTNLTINTSGQAKFKSLNTSGGAGNKFTVKGTLNITDDVHLNSDDTINIIGGNSSVEFSKQASANIKSDGKTLDIASGTFANVFDLKDGGNLKLKLEGQTFSLEQIKELRKTLLKDANNDGSAKEPVDGYIHLGNAFINFGGSGGSGNGFSEVPFDKYDPDTGEFTPYPMPSIDGNNASGDTSDGQTILALSAKNQKTLDALADIKEWDTRTDTLDDVLLYDINNDENDVVRTNDVKANVGALMVNEGDRANIKSATLSHAYYVKGNGGRRQFITSQNDRLKDDSLLGANIRSGGSLKLENGGYIGDVTLENGSNSDATRFRVNARNTDKPYGSGDDGITFISSINGGANTLFENYDVTKVTSGDISVGSIQNASELTITNGNLVVTDKSTFTSDSTTNVSGDISFGTTTTIVGQITASGNIKTTTTDANESFNLVNGAKITANTADFNATQLDINGNILLTQGGTFAGETINLGSGSAISSSGGDLSFEALSAANNSNFTQNANSRLNGNNLDITTINDVTLDGNNSFTGSGSIIAANRLNLGGTQSFVGGAEFVGNTINLAAQSSITSSGDLNFYAPSSGTSNGNFVQDTQSGLRGRNLNITAGNDVTLAGNNAFTGSGFISADHEINLGGSQSFASGASFTGNTINLGSGSTVTNTSGDLNFTGLVKQDSGSVITAPVVTFDNTSVTQNPDGNTSVLAGNNSFNQATLKGNYKLYGTNQIDDLTIASGNSTFLGANNNIQVLHAQDNTGVLQIGTDGSSASKTEASMQIAQLQLNGSTLYVDPDYGAPTSLVAVTNRASTNNPSSKALDGSLDGNLVLGKNAATAWGEDLKALREDIAAYQSDGSLRYSTNDNDNTFGTILVLNQPLQVTEGNHVILNSNVQNTNLADAEKLATISDGRTADLALSDQSLLVVKLGAVGPTEETNTPAIKFNKNHAVVYSEGGQIVLDGIYDVRKEIDVFADNDTASGNNKFSGVELVGNDIRVSSKNGLFNTTLLSQDGASSDNVGHIKLTASARDVEDYFYQASNPVKDTLVKYKDSTPDANGTSNYLNAVLTTGDRGHAAETAARMGVYGGAINIALAASEVASEAVARRTNIGFGAPGGNSFKPVGQLEVWGNPVYSRKDSNGYSAQGVEYGNNLDLQGLNFGAEAKLTKDITVGGLFNIGQGNVDGKGAGSGIKNDFDYYGFGLYATTKIENFSLVGDISYHKVSNDLNSTNVVDRLSTSIDSSNLSLGVTGRMDLKLNGVKVSPHAGLRYQHIKMDSYGINGARYGRIVDYGADDFNVLSLPIGVTLSNDYITSEGWQLRPAIDFTGTVNIGDRDANGTASWTGSNFVTPLSTEVLDPFVYGINIGISARKDRFGVGGSLKYTGSSNTSDIGLQVDLRYDF